MSLPVVAAAPALREALWQGHPWVYRNQVVPLRAGATLPQYPSGTWVKLLCGKFEGVGLWEAQGAIAVRLYSRHQAPDARWVAGRVRAAWELRAPLRQADMGTNAYRWIYGESDGLPGIVVDLYGDYAALHLYSAGVATLLEPLLVALRELVPLKGIVLRRSGQEASSAEGSAQTETLWGRPPPRDLVVVEHGLRMYANLREGQKTGLFLDQRENRLYLEPWCRGRRVLNAFSYTGAFTLYAIRGGASQVTSVDVAPTSADEAQRNCQLNGLDPQPHTFVVADCFAWLEECARSDRRYDLVILDPPSLAKDKANRYAAVRAYARLNRLALGCLRPGGLLASASCTSQVSLELFREALATAAAQAEQRLTLLHEAGQPLDHPVPAHFPEARYLKFILAQANGIT